MQTLRRARGHYATAPLTTVGSAGCQSTTERREPFAPRQRSGTVEVLRNAPGHPARRQPATIRAS